MQYTLWRDGDIICCSEPLEKSHRASKSALQLQPTFLLITSYGVWVMLHITSGRTPSEIKSVYSSTPSGRKNDVDRTLINIYDEVALHTFPHPADHTADLNVTTVGLCGTNRALCSQNHWYGNEKNSKTAVKYVISKSKKVFLPTYGRWGGGVKKAHWRLDVCIEPRSSSDFTYLFYVKLFFYCLTNEPLVPSGSSL